MTTGIVWQSLLYRALAITGLNVGATSIYEDPSRTNRIEPQDVLVLYQATTERCLATQTTAGNLWTAVTNTSTNFIALTNTYCVAVGTNPCAFQTNFFAPSGTYTHVSGFLTLVSPAPWDVHPPVTQITYRDYLGLDTNRNPLFWREVKINAFDWHIRPVIIDTIGDKLVECIPFYADDTQTNALGSFDSNAVIPTLTVTGLFDRLDVGTNYGDGSFDWTQEPDLFTNGGLYLERTRSIRGSGKPAWIIARCVAATSYGARRSASVAASSSKTA